MNDDIAYIYQIKNILNGKIYIGSTKNYKKRFSNHKHDLKNNKHKNTHLQSAWNLYGGENFEFKMLKTCKKSKQFEIETKEINKIMKKLGVDNVYNIISNPHQQAESYAIKSKISKGWKYCSECGELFLIFEEDEIDMLHEYYKFTNCEMTGDLCYDCQVEEYEELADIKRVDEKRDWHDFFADYHVNDED